VNCIFRASASKDLMSGLHSAVYLAEIITHHLNLQ
jgi:hypothetical protein